MSLIGLIIVLVVIGLILWLVIVPGLCFGFTQNLIWLGQWAHIMLVPYLQGGGPVYIETQSVPSYLARLLCHSAAFTSTVSGPFWSSGTVKS